MVSLTMMSRLVEAVRPDARLVLVGDPDQLASVEAGAVLGDLVERPVAATTPTATQVESSAGSDLAGLSAHERERLSPRVSCGSTTSTGSPRTIAGARRRHPQRRDPTTCSTCSPRATRASSSSRLTPEGAIELDALRADVVSAGSALVDAARAGDAPGRR